MSTTDTVGTIVRFLIVLFVLSLVVGQLLGQPILLSYVTSDSMSPTIEEGDGFLVVPTALADEPTVGDVVVYRSQTLRPGELVTHRVVDTRNSAFVTKGDNNVFVDQGNGEPLVRPDRVKAVAVSLDGDPIVIPHLGTAVRTLQGGAGIVQEALAQLTGYRAFLGAGGAGYLLLGLGVFLLAVSLLTSPALPQSPDRSRQRGRPTVSVLLVVLVMSALVAGPVTAAMVLSGGEERFTFISSTTPSSDLAVESGSTTTGTYRVSNEGVLPVVVMFEPRHEDLRLDRTQALLGPGESVETTVSIAVPREPGYYERSFAERRYFTVLPPAWIVALDEIHPLAALAAVNSVPVGVVVALVVLLFGHRPILLRDRSSRRGGRFRFGRR